MLAYRASNAPGRVRYSPPMAPKRDAALEAMIEEATVDAYNDDEQLTVKKVDLTGDSIVTICVRGRHRQRIGLLDLPLPAPPPDGTVWIDAYRHWAGR
ncbi:hypothetical protein [Actinoplanes sp. NPDC049599]|uniref:hypothetical protein n=1 Tax=Actinoplanes sp. NPDC049599 TaxID=3363903 RepID=UPI003794D280